LIKGSEIYFHQNKQTLFVAKPVEDICGSQNNKYLGQRLTTGL
jgi:hypothetical protein